MENVIKFYDALANDEAMRERADALNEKHEGTQLNEDAAKTAILAFAKAEGYEFSAKELDAYAKQAKPLTDDELEAVAGGVYSAASCFCVAGGGGKDPETGRTCVCVLGGGGAKDNEGNCLVCVFAGAVKCGLLGQ